MVQNWVSGAAPVEPAVLTQWDDSGLLVPATPEDHAAVHQDVAEEEEDLRLRPPSALLDQAALPQQNPTRFGAERLLHRLLEGPVVLVHCSGWVLV